MTNPDAQAITAPAPDIDDLQRWLEDILATSKTGFLVVDDTLQLKYANRAVRELVAAGNDTDDILAILELQSPNSARIFRSADHTGSWEGLYARDGRILNLLVSPLAGSPGSPANVRNYLVEVRDNTREVVEMQQLNEQNVQARETEKIRTEFIDHISHEFKTPLHAILGYSEHILSDGDMPDRYRDDLQEIAGASRRLLASVNDMLEASRNRGRKISVNPEPVELDGLFAECVSLLGKSAALKNINVVHDGAGIKTVTDRIRLKQVILNLLGNAIRFNRYGGDVRLLATELPGAFQVAVLDTGPGIAPERQASLLAPMARLGQAAGGINKSGLGLVICKRLLALLKGELHFASYPGAGSVFGFRLPLNRPQIVPPVAPETTAVERLIVVDGGAGGSEFCAGLARIYPALECLHLDDSADLCRLGPLAKSLILVFADRPGDTARTLRDTLVLKQTAVLVVSAEGTIESFESFGVCETFDARENAESTQPGTWPQLAGKAFTLPRLCQLIDGR